LFISTKEIVSIPRQLQKLFVMLQLSENLENCVKFTIVASDFVDTDKPIVALF